MLIVYNRMSLNSDNKMLQTIITNPIKSLKILDNDSIVKSVRFKDDIKEIIIPRDDIKEEKDVYVEAFPKDILPDTIARF